MPYPPVGASRPTIVLTTSCLSAARARSAVPRKGSQGHGIAKAKRYVLALTVVAWCCTGAALALDPNWPPSQYLQRRWDSQHGLPTNSINWLHVDSNGYLIIGTFGGVVRFDGARFQPLRASWLDDLPPETLRGSAGRAWFRVIEKLNDAGISHLEMRALLPWTDLRSLSEEDDGSLLLATLKGLLRITTTEGEIEHDWLFSREGVITVLRDARGRIWLGTPDGVLREDAPGQWVRVPSIPGRIFVLLEDQSGRVWVAGNEGVRVVSGDETIALDLDDGLPEGRVRSMLMDQDGNVWVGVMGQPLVRFRTDVERLRGEKLQTINHSARHILEDSHGHLWVGTTGGGLVRLSDGAFETLSLPDGLGNEYVVAVAVDERGNVWAGTAGGGLTTFPPTGQPTRYGESHGLSDTNAVAVATDGSRVIVGTPSGVFEGRDGRFRFVFPTAPTSGFTLRQVAVAADGSLWAGGNGGALRWDGDRLERVDLPDVPGEQSVLSFATSRSGGLWIGAHGLFHWQDGVLSQPVAKGISRPIRAVFEDSRGVVWLATSPGLIRVDGESIREMKVPNAVDQVVHDIYLDPRNRFWLPTNDGLARVSRAELDRLSLDEAHTVPWELFHQNDGLPSTEFNGYYGSTIAVGPDSRLWFANSAGLVRVDPNVEPTVSAIRARFERAVASDGTAITPGVTLPPHERRVEFHFTAIDLSTPQSQRFRYKLEPIETEWVSAGEARSTTYRNLPPGAFRFRVAAAGADGTYREALRAFEFQIAQFWWERRSVRVAGLVILLGTALVAPLLWSRRARRRQLELEQLVSEKTRELKDANAQLDRSAKTDPLTGAANRRGFIELAERDRHRCLREKQPVSLILADVDHFKQINDSHGHAAGDALLVQLTSRLRAELRAHDLVGRWGGEEFVVLLTNTSLPDAATVAAKLRSAVCSTHFDIASGPVPVTLTLGVAEWQPGESLDQALHRADLALYQGKEAGRDRVERAPHSQSVDSQTAAASPSG